MGIDREPQQTVIGFETLWDDLADIVKDGTCRSFIADLIGTAQEQTDKKAHAAATLALHTGLRRMEILNLRSSDVDLNAGKLSVIGKGRKRRVVPLNQMAKKVVRELMARPTSDDFLFHSRTGNTLSHKQGPFQSAVCTAKIADLHFHDLRHTFSTRMRALTDLSR